MRAAGACAPWGSLGRYDYRGTLFGSGADLSTTFDGEASYGAALLGYQFRAQALIVKLFAGIEAEDQNITPPDPANSVQGSAVGLKLQAESWLDVSPLWFLSVDASYGTAATCRSASIALFRLWLGALPAPPRQCCPHRRGVRRMLTGSTV